MPLQPGFGNGLHLHYRGGSACGRTVRARHDWVVFYPFFQPLLPKTVFPGPTGSSGFSRQTGNKGKAGVFGIALALLPHCWRGHFDPRCPRGPVVLTNQNPFGSEWPENPGACPSNPHAPRRTHRSHATHRFASKWSNSGLWRRISIQKDRDRPVRITRTGPEKAAAPDAAALCLDLLTLLARDLTALPLNFAFFRRF